MTFFHLATPLIKHTVLTEKCLTKVLKSIELKTKKVRQKNEKVILDISNLAHYNTIKVLYNMSN